MSWAIRGITHRKPTGSRGNPVAGCILLDVVRRHQWEDLSEHGKRTQRAAPVRLLVVVADRPQGAGQGEAVFRACMVVQGPVHLASIHLREKDINALSRRQV